MTQFVFANNVNTTLSAPISNTATTLTLASSANLPSSIPAGEYFALTLNDAATRLVYEIVYATAVSGATLTVVRGQEGTTAQAWATGDFAFSGPTAGQMESFNTGEGVSSFNTRTGAVTLSSTDVNTALGYTAANAANVVNSFNTRKGAVVLNSTDVDTALGYTPANDASVVHIAGAETITGSKTFSSPPIAAGSLAAWQFQERDAASNVWTWYATGALASLYITGFGNTCTVSHAGAWTFAGGISTTTGAFSGAVSASSYGAVNGTTGTFSGALSATTGTFSSSVTCTTMNATSSDRRLKRNIHKANARPLHRSVKFVGYTMKDSGWYGLGSIAQNVKRYAPEHVGTFEKDGKTYLSLNYAGMAYEQAIWDGQETDRLTKRIAKLEQALDRAKIEPRKRGFVRRLLEAIW